MAKTGDSRPARSIKADFDTDFCAFSYGGAALIERVMRKMRMRRKLAEFLPSRNRSGGYAGSVSAYAALAGMLCGGRGFQAAELLRACPDLAEVFGLLGSVPEEATQYRVACDLAGLQQRIKEEHYEEVPEAPCQLDMYGNEKKQPKTRRLVPAEPEEMIPARKEAFASLLASTALAAIGMHPNYICSLFGFFAIHGDATDLEVEGNCFDAGRKDHEGNKSLRWMTVKLGPVTVAEEVFPGASDEGTRAPKMLDRASEKVISKAGKDRKALALFDAAYCEGPVFRTLRALRWKYVICANQMRAPMTVVAGNLPSGEWKTDRKTKKAEWAESELAVFNYCADTWDKPETVIARRWRGKGELKGVWHYSFLVTDLSPEDLPKRRVRKYGFEQTVWMMYGTKQGHENYYKRTLSDLGLHNPPSGRLGATQAHYTLGSVAANIQAVISYRVVTKKDRGIRMRRFFREYVALSGQLIRRCGGVLFVRLAGAGVAENHRTRWLEAFANAEAL